MSLCGHAGQKEGDVRGKALYQFEKTDNLPEILPEQHALLESRAACLISVSPER